MTRDELIDILYAHGGHFNYSIEHVADEIMEAIGDVHGKWEDVTSSLDCNYKTYNCSACNSMRLIDYKSNYCPSCGAKMDLK